MNFTPEHVAELRSILTTCKAVGLDAVVFADGMAMSANDKRTLALITPSPLVPPGGAKIGINRINELSKRLDLFTGEVSIEGKEGQRGEMVILTMSAGRTKAQYRCTSTSMIPHPKENADPAHSVIKLSREEAQTLFKAIKTFGAESAVLKVASSGDVHIECVDSTNDQFSTVLSTAAEFVNEAENVLFTYAAPTLSTVLEVGARDAEELQLVLGEGGSLTIDIKGRSIVVISNADED